MQDRLTQRALKTGGWLAAVTALTLFLFSHSTWAWSFLVGAGLSLFSLLSLTVVIPILFRPGMPRGVTALLGVTMFMKLPLYVLGLYLMVHLARGATVALVAGVAGLALGPVVIVCKTLGGLVVEAYSGRLTAPVGPLYSEAQSRQQAVVQQSAMAVGEGV